MLVMQIGILQNVIVYQSIKSIKSILLLGCRYSVYIASK